ncbi:MAG TPA: M13 family metallopeptidase [Luteibacter sp.]|jgi:putative endopeptidase|uniref:M13 family metallopeptidase n=1 Tax=Luteibacter sp. TaxID=1886636 RepID=UPI002F404184
MTRFHPLKATAFIVLAVVLFSVREAPVKAAPPGGGSVFDVRELDEHSNACENLDTFVNRKWIAANPIPDDHTSWGAFDQLMERNLGIQHDIVEDAALHADQAARGSVAQKIGWLYRAGMDESALEKAGADPVKPALRAIARLDTSEEIAGYILKGFVAGEQHVFNFGSGADLEDGTKQIGFATQGGLSLPTPAYYVDARYADIRAAFTDYVSRSLELSGIPQADAAREAADVIALETQIASASLSAAELRNPANVYHVVSIDEASRVTPHFNWKAFFAGQHLAVDTFSLSQPKFFAEFDRLLASAPPRQWQAYLRFHTIDDASPYLSNAFAANRFAFYGKALSGQPAESARWKRVLGVVNESMGQALGQLYVAREFSPAAKQRAEALTVHVLAALKQRIENADWMTAETRRKAIEKWSLMVAKVGYPDHWRPWDGLVIQPGDYYGSVMAATRFNYEYDIGHIGRPTDRSEWDMPPQRVNAYYSRSTNTVNLPAAILQPPFFYEGGDDAINYGGAGALIGHEATHGFDDRGRQYDGNGKRADWWTAEDETEFKRRASILVDQFNSYAPIKEKPDLHVNGELTLGENIADLGGLNIAYDALENALASNPAEARKKIDGYTQEQRFFISSARIWRNNIRPKSAEVLLNADKHAPTSLRAIVAPSNSAAFAAAFKCGKTAPMVRPAEKQVKIW